VLLTQFILQLQSVRLSTSVISFPFREELLFTSGPQMDNFLEHCLPRALSGQRLSIHSLKGECLLVRTFVLLYLLPRSDTSLTGSLATLIHQLTRVAELTLVNKTSVSLIILLRVLRSYWHVGWTVQPTLDIQLGGSLAFVSSIDIDVIVLTVIQGACDT
jgi:hypothetical protein